MKVYALVGKSGTGKSFQATYLCGELNIEYIVDDGLLIGGGTVLAGISAKRQQTKIGAVKTALFTEEMHRSAVLEKLEELAPESLLIIGTSDEMVGKIRLRLHLPEFERTIYIEEITTEEERKTAARQRNEQGQHVIPAPALQLKQQFSGYFMDPLRRFMGRTGKLADVSGGGLGRFSAGSGNSSAASAIERTVVRPTYSYLGEYKVSDKVIFDIVNYICWCSGVVSKTAKVSIYKTDSGIQISAGLIMKYSADVRAAAGRIQRRIAEETEMMTAFHVEAVNIEIKGLK